MSATACAIVGMACRAAHVASPDELWNLFVARKSVVGPVPAERWNADAVHDPSGEKFGTCNSRSGAFLHGVAGFDCAAFGISPREARAIDPQQRWLLTLSWEALQASGLGAGTTRPWGRGGVFVALGNDGEYRALKPHGGVSRYDGPGDTPGAAAARVAHVFGCTGPALAIDAVETGSLAAVQLAQQALGANACDFAIVGATNLMLGPGPMIRATAQRLLASDGDARPFDTEAHGTALGEGGAVLVLQRLDDAQAQQRRIHAVIYATALRHAGAKDTFFGAHAQSLLACHVEACKNAQIPDEPASEAHGDGARTKSPQLAYVLSDARGVATSDAETWRALAQVAHGSAQTIHVGAIAGAIGDMRCAAGLLALVQMALAVEHREVPVCVGARKPLTGLRLDVATRPAPWDPRDAYGAVWSQGLLGQSACAIVGAPRIDATRAKVRPVNAHGERTAHLLTLSARDGAGLGRLAAACAGRIEGMAASELADFCYSMNTAAPPLRHRMAVAAQDSTEMQALLRADRDGDAIEGRSIGSVHGNADAARVLFLFPGQGGQYWGMARELYDVQPLFRDTVDACAAVVDPMMRRPLHDLLFAQPDDEAALQETNNAQPALFAVDLGLARLWRAWGIEPDVLLGHSFGEYVAACLAGVYDLETALRMCMERGRLAHLAGREPGSMLIAFTDVPTAQRMLSPWAAQVSVAAINTPGNTVLSGATEALRAVQNKLEAEGIQTRALRTSFASHCPLLDPLLDAYEAFGKQFTFHAPDISIISTATGAHVSKQQPMDASYWRHQWRNPVRFDAALRVAVAEHCNVFIEMGPHATLLGMLTGAVDSDAAMLASMRRQASAWKQMLGSLGTLFVRGLPVDFEAFDAPFSRRRLEVVKHPLDAAPLWFTTAR